MLKKEAQYILAEIIERWYGCDNCEHDVDGLAGDYCEYCEPGRVPSKYRPQRYTAFEKCWYGDWDRLTYKDCVEVFGDEED